MSFTLEQAFFSRDSQAGLGVYGCSTEDKRTRKECDTIGGKLAVAEKEAEFTLYYQSRFIGARFTQSADGIPTGLHIFYPREENGDDASALSLRYPYRNIDRNTELAPIVLEPDLGAMSER